MGDVQPSPPSLFETEREALARLLASGIFARSPNLEKLLVYICTKYFESASNQIKEYHLATEALGRPENFDPKRDSIVRVEMHRLRRRLREYYDANPSEPVRIDVPEKSYTPVFRGHSTGTTAATPVAELVPAVLVDARRRDVATRIARPLALGAALSAAILTALFVWFRPADRTSPDAPRVQTAALAEVAVEPVEPVVPVSETEVRIMAGRSGERYVDRYGQTWNGDRYHRGGAAVPIQADVETGGFDANLFSGMREGDFRYDIPLKPGTYELLLLFAETFYGPRNPLGGGESSRTFHISANGKMLVRDFDVISEAAGPNALAARLFRDIAPDTDGKLHLQFHPTGSGKPFVNAILIRPGIPGKLRPIRIVCQPRYYRDGKGNVWNPDVFHRGGVQIVRPHGAPAEDSDLFRGERYGNFAYVIPVAPGKYNLNLYFWEYWWGADHPGKGGRGSRRFDVFANHSALLREFDIIAQNPKDQVTVQSFRGLEPDAQNKLVLQFVPKQNYAMINAIELVNNAH